MKIMIWEYMVEDLAPTTPSKDVLFRLNALGREGWELVLVRERKIPSAAPTMRMVFLFKRPIGYRDSGVK